MTLAATIHPRPGFPFLLDTRVRYALAADGLTVTHEATNVGERSAPWAAGAHPYLAVGGTTSSTLRLTVPASTVLVTDERLVPVGRAAVDAEGAPGADLRAGRIVGELDLDTGGFRAGAVDTDHARVELELEVGEALSDGEVALDATRADTICDLSGVPVS